MIWLFEKDTFDEGNPAKMMDIVKSMGHDAHWINYIPFGGGIEGGHFDETMPYLNKTPVMAYGSIGMCKYVTKTELGWDIWFNESKLTCQHYYSAIGRYCLNHEYAMFPLKDAHRLEEFLFSSINRTQFPNSTRKIFIRPDSNDKIFTGSVVDRSNFKEWFRIANIYVEEGQDVLCVATPVWDIRDEWRTVVWNGKVVAASKYQENKQSVRIEDMNPEVVEYVEHVIKETGFQPHPVMCFDACRLDTGVIRILEIGSVNCAGLYACNLEKVVEAMTEQAIIDKNAPPTVVQIG